MIRLTELLEEGWIGVSRFTREESGREYEYFILEKEDSNMIYDPLLKNIVAVYTHNKHYKEVEK